MPFANPYHTTTIRINIHLSLLSKSLFFILMIPYIALGGGVMSEMEETTVMAPKEEYMPPCIKVGQAHQHQVLGSKMNMSIVYSKRLMFVIGVYTLSILMTIDCYVLRNSYRSSARDWLICSWKMAIPSHYTLFIR